MYSKLVDSLSSAYARARTLGIEDQSLSKSINDIILADYLGHELSSGGQGSDAYDDLGHYEYKCSATDNFNFHLGANKGVDANLKLIEKKFNGISAIFCASVNNEGVQKVARCETKNFIQLLRRYVIERLRGGQFILTLNWEKFTNIEGAVVAKASRTNTYPKIAEDLKKSLRICNELGIDTKLFSKGGHNHLFLAQKLGHILPEDGRGPDAFDSEGGGYEYKITMGDNFNFHFGARKTQSENEELVKNKCRSMVGAYCVKRNYEKLEKVFYIPSNELEKILLDSFSQSTGKQLLKNFKPNQLERRGYLVSDI